MTFSADNPPDVAGKTVVLAGLFDNIGRMEARLGLQKLGANLVKELDASVSFIVAKGGPKVEQAQAMGIPQIDEPTLAALLAADAKPQAAAVADEGPRLPKVAGAVVIIAGTLEVMGRPVAKRKLEKLGAIVTDKLDEGVSFVVAGEKGGPTLFNAKQLGIPQIDEATLQALVAQLPADEEDAVGPGSPIVLSGTAVVLAGVPGALGRLQALRRLEKLGATVAERVDRNVKYVFVCQGGTSTLFQARELGIRQVDEATLMELIADVADDAEDRAASGPSVADLAGKKVLITGTLLEVGRAEAKRKLTALGAEVVDRLTDDIGYVVAGQEGGRNLFLAKQASLPIITEPVLLPLLAQAPEGEADNRPAVPGPDALPGLRLVIAGKLNRVDRAQARRKLQRAGAQVVDDVEAGVACVFAGEKGGRNLLLALQQSLPVFDERALTDLLDQLPDAAPQDAPGAAPDLPDLGGRTVVLTGKLQHIDRRDAVDRLRRLGATLLERVDDHPDFVITGDKGGRAVFVAKQESIPVLDEETLLAILDRAGLPRSEAGAPGPGGAAAPPDLRGATVAFTGTFPDLDLAAVKQRLCAHDVTVHPGITAATQYVVVGVKPSQTTLFRVKQLGLDTLDAATLLAFLQD